MIVHQKIAPEIILGIITCFGFLYHKMECKIHISMETGKSQ